MFSSGLCKTSCLRLGLSFSNSQWNSQANGCPFSRYRLCVGWRILNVSWLRNILLPKLWAPVICHCGEVLHRHDRVEHCRVSRGSERRFFKPFGYVCRNCKQTLKPGMKSSYYSTFSPLSILKQLSPFIREQLDFIIEPGHIISLSTLN